MKTFTSLTLLGLLAAAGIAGAAPDEPAIEVIVVMGKYTPPEAIEQIVVTAKFLPQLLVEKVLAALPLQRPALDLDIVAVAGL